ncbi:hypothetical protein ACFYWO_01125 [Streptomyces sp. NPDC002932]|uniref:hypothetical protein n=1 Tax=Streptomyces sp. NPDC002932 TaxID=3364672 RepID=UPI003687EF91
MAKKDAHLTKAKNFVAAAEQLVDDVTDPGQKAQTFALIAIAHALMETGYDIDNVKTAIEEHE